MTRRGNSMAGREVGLIYLIEMGNTLEIAFSKKYRKYMLSVLPQGPRCKESFQVISLICPRGLVCHPGYFLEQRGFGWKNFQNSTLENKTSQNKILQQVPKEYNISGKTGGLDQNMQRFLQNEAGSHILFWTNKLYIVFKQK